MAIRVAIAANVNARCRPLANGCSMSLGKKERPVMYATCFGWQVLEGAGRPEQFLNRVVAEERREQAADRRLVGHGMRGGGADARRHQPLVQGAGQPGREPERDDREEQAHRQHGRRVLERVEHARACAALLGRQAVHDRGLVGREEQPHANREQEDQRREPDVAEVDRQRLQQQEGSARHDQAGGGEQPGPVPVRHPACQRADDEEAVP